MTKEQYDKLTPGEKLLFEEYTGFTKRLLERIDALTAAVQKLLEVATTDP